ncbi:hypothetical protein Tco_0996500 [Tanacetum coccineum]
MYVNGHVDIFDMVNIDLFTVVALNMMVVQLGYTGESEHLFYNFLRPLTSLDEGLYALASEIDVRCLATLVGSFKLIEVFITWMAFGGNMTLAHWRGNGQDYDSTPRSMKNCTLRAGRRRHTHKATASRHSW